LALHSADEDLPAHELELLELVKKLRIEQGRSLRFGHRAVFFVGWVSEAQPTTTACDWWVALRLPTLLKDSDSQLTQSETKNRLSMSIAAMPRPTSQGTRAARKIVQRARRLSERRRWRKPRAVNQLSRITRLPPMAVMNATIGSARHVTIETINSVA